MAGPPTTKIDLHAAVWTIPATRMKAKREHLVPLCRRAVQLLEAAQALHEGSELVFPSPHGHVIAYRAFYQILQAVRSLKLFSLAALYDANKELLRPVLERDVAILVAALHSRNPRHLQRSALKVAN